MRWTADEICIKCDLCDDSAHTFYNKVQARNANEVEEYKAFCYNHCDPFFEEKEILSRNSSSDGFTQHDHSLQFRRGRLPAGSCTILPWPSQQETVGLLPKAHARGAE
jgi:hypothetical protein